MTKHPRTQTQRKQNPAAKARTRGTKQTARKRPAAKKTAAMKTAAKKTAAKKTAAKKTAAKKTAAKRNGRATATARKRTASKRNPSAVRSKSHKTRPVAKKKSAKKTPVTKQKRAAATRSTSAAKKASPAAGRKRAAKSATGKRQSPLSSARTPRAVKKKPAKSRALLARSPSATRRPSRVKAKPTKRDSEKQCPAVATRAPAPQNLRPAPAMLSVSDVAVASRPRAAQAPAQPPAQPPAESGHTGSVRVGRLPPRSSQRARLTQSQGLLSDQTWAEAQALAQRLGAGTLSELQKRIIGASLEGRNVVASLAAGQGKSTCAAIVAQLCGGVAVILSPSPRLTREQQQRLEHRRVPALRLDPNAPEANQVKLCGELGSGEPAVLFTTPAALAGCPTVRDALRERGVTLCVVEEAQTLAESSHSVSPSLTAWRRLLVDLGRPTVLALLAPASFTSRRQVTECLELGAPVVIEAEPIRENVSVEVHRLSGDARKRAFSALAQELRRPGLILATTAREVEEIHALLAAARVPAHRYHADLSPSERLGEQLNFMLPGRKTVMVAQSAFAPSTGIAGIDDERLLDGAPRGFGFGLDKRDLRFLVHWGAPASAEQCAREIGAIGRDGDEARAIVYCDEGDTSRNGALLLRHRLHPPHAAALADALDGQVFETRKTNFEALALETGLSLATVESWCSVFESAGLLRVTAGWLETLTSPREIMECATEISARLWQLQREDERRLNSMRDVLLDPGCHRAALSRVLGARSTACGRCPPCLSGAGAPASRRAPAQTFSVTSLAGGNPAPQTAQLSAKVGEFDYLKTGARSR